MRFLAIFQIKPDGSFQQVKQNSDGIYTVGNWNISAQLNTSKPANIQVWNNDKTEMLVSDGILNLNGKTYNGADINSSKLISTKNGKVVFLESMDKIPAAIKRVMQLEK